MRTDERIALALQDPEDLRPLLLGSSERELAPLRRHLAADGDVGDANNLAKTIEHAIKNGLPAEKGHAPLFRLGQWAARRLGSSVKVQNLEEADAEIVHYAGSGERINTGNDPELSFPGGGDLRLLQIAIALAQLRHRKTKALRRWQPLLDWFVKDTGSSATSQAAKARSATQGATAKSSPAGTAINGDLLWDSIKGAAGQLPLSVWEEKLKEARKDIGRFNIIVAGRTGVGKTTLIGAIFGEEVGDTLMGRPRTRGRIWYPQTPGEADILRLCDTEGLEMERYKETLDGLKREIELRNSSSDPFDHIHVAWLCIDEPSLTVQPGEEALVEMLQNEGIPVVVVLTKAGMAPQFEAKVRELLPGAKAVIRVRAKPITIERQTFSQIGLDRLLAVTEDIIPSAVEAAWNVASRNLAAMHKRAQQTVKRAAAAAGAAGAAPIPLADAAGVFGVQVGMIITISLQMGVRLQRSDLRAMAMTLIGALGLTAGGRFLAGQVVKLIPGLGTIAGSAITGSTAAALTYGLGHAYTEYLRGFYEENERMPNADELVTGFRVFWRRWKNKQEMPPPAINT